MKNEASPINLRRTTPTIFAGVGVWCFNKWNILTSLLSVGFLLAPLASAESTIEASSAIRASLSASNKLSISEGLPHQNYERALLEKERKRKDVAEIGGFPFYTPKYLAPPEQRQTLKEILSSAESFVPHTIEKDCGGFHPDFAISWLVEKEERSVLLCYGCNEALFLAGGEKHRYDLRGVLPKLEKALVAFQAKRPGQQGPAASTAEVTEKSRGPGTYYLHLFSNRYDIYVAANDYGTSKNRKEKENQCIATIAITPGAEIYADLPNHYEPSIKIQGKVTKRGNSFHGSLEIAVDGVDVANVYEQKAPIAFDTLIPMPGNEESFQIAISDKRDGYAVPGFAKETARSPVK